MLEQQTRQLQRKRDLSKAPATLVAICTYAVMAGFFTQSGVILGPAASYFERSVTDTAAMFSYLIGGNLVGIVISLRIFDFLSIKRTLTCAYLVMFAGIAILWATHSFAIALFAFVLVGLGGGLGLSAGAVIIVKTYATQRRATAFLATDCAFSVAGFLVPAGVLFALAHGYRWAAGYALVGVFAAGVLVVAARVRLIPARSGVDTLRVSEAPVGAPTLVRIGLFGLGLALYLFGQSVFLLWAPTALQALYGLPAIEAGGVVSRFWGPSIFGLIGAALLVTRVAPRIVLVVAASIATLCLYGIATASNASIFFALTLAFGCVSTCMYKLMISIGSEQIARTPPQLVTFLLLSGSIGGTLAPFASAGLVRAFGPHAGPFLSLVCYALALATIVIALTLERSARRPLAAAAFIGEA